MRAWRAYILGTELLRQQLHRELQDAHGMTIADYEVLVQLSERTERRMRMTQLAGRVASSKSRLSHQIARMEKAGLVRRVDCPEDARGVVAELTDKGMAQLRAAAPTHVSGVREHLVDLLTDDEQETLATIFERVHKHLDQLN
ncbi:MarR family winged helix-turn-helix transcriptional regulator [Actinophytocola sp.]|uniref:MarR family winged helix-turn-helix transcriptional regulator n=1 Tax=Actinophytocola sp. TaxID=1872138 RepID=UPI002D7F5F54|nr:MarR family transcriptional regulator [Actinophytocola sp.]HET9142675.1 MarR family transcriptional regulator [Actinophytocola sp.]